jgi:hypothetical protein
MENNIWSDFKKKPVIIKAFKITKEFFTDCKMNEEVVPGVHVILTYSHPYLVVMTLEGMMTAQIGDWLIQGVKGEYYPCKDDIFKLTYDDVSSTTSQCLQ